MMFEALAHVSGQVQGVGYRYFCKRVAEKHEVFGYAHNREDGTVDVLAQGPQDNVSNFFLELQGEKPHLAIVEKVEIEYSKEINACTHTTFKVK